MPGCPELRVGGLCSWLLGPPEAQGEDLENHLSGPLLGPFKLIGRTGGSRETPGTSWDGVGKWGFEKPKRSPGLGFFLAFHSVT